MRTWLTERFGLTVPVVAAPMAGVSTGRLAAAVSASGGLGMIGTGPAAKSDRLREQCGIAREAGPFGVGLMAWALALDDALVDVVAAEAPALMSLSYGPYERWIEPLRAAGIVVATQVGTLAEARAAERAGVDLLVARGGEGGGHGRADVATLPLLAKRPRRGAGPGGRGRWHRHGAWPRRGARRRCRRGLSRDRVPRLHRGRHLRGCSCPAPRGEGHRHSVRTRLRRRSAPALATGVRRARPAQRVLRPLGRPRGRARQRR